MGALGQRLLAAGLQLFQSVLANGLQHHESGFTPRRLDLLHQALVHHRRHAVEQVQAQIAFGIAHRFHAFQRASAHEHRQSSEELLLGGIQQIVAPIDGSAKGLLPQRQVSGSARQQVQSARQACPHGRRRKNLDPGGGQFDGERQTIEPDTDVGDVGRVFSRQFKIRLGGDGTFNEQRDRGVLGQRVRRRAGTADPAGPAPAPEIHVLRRRAARRGW